MNENKSTRSKVEFVRLFFGRNVGMKKSFRIFLTFKRYEDELKVIFDQWHLGLDALRQNTLGCAKQSKNFERPPLIMILDFPQEKCRFFLFTSSIIIP